MALSALASPNWPTRTSGLAFCAAAVAASAGSTRSSATVVVAGDLERDQRGAAVLGELALVALRDRGLDLVDVGRPPAVDTTSLTAAAKLASPTFTEPLPCTSTCSSAARGSRRWRSPGRRPSRSRCRSPPRRSTAGRRRRQDERDETNASQPKMAVLRCGRSSGLRARRDCWIARGKPPMKLGESPGSFGAARCRVWERTGVRRCGQPHPYGEASARRSCGSRERR